MDKTKRDEHNMLDRDDADARLRALQKTLVEETIAKNKDSSFATAAGSRRDIIVKFQIYIRNTVDGNVVRSDYEDKSFENLSGEANDPYRYKLHEYVDGEIDVRDMPMSPEKYGKWLYGCFVSINGYLAKMGITTLVGMKKP